MTSLLKESHSQTHLREHLAQLHCIPVNSKCWLYHHHHLPHYLTHETEKNESEVSNPDRGLEGTHPPRLSSQLLVPENFNGHERYVVRKHDGWEMGMDNVDMGHGGTSKVVRLLMVSRVRVKRCVWCMRDSAREVLNSGMNKGYGYEGYRWVTCGVLMHMDGWTWNFDEHFGWILEVMQGVGNKQRVMGMNGFSHAWGYGGCDGAMGAGVSSMPFDFSSQWSLARASRCK